MNEAIKLLGQMTNGRFDAWNMFGDYNATNRAQIMATLQGVAKVPKAKAGVTALEQALFACFEPPYACLAVKRAAFVEFCRKQAQQ